MRFRSRPGEVEAVQWAGTNYMELTSFGAPVSLDDGRVLYLKAGKNGAQGSVFVPQGHWIVRDVHDPSDYWPVDPIYFADKYEIV